MTFAEQDEDLVAPWPDLSQANRSTAAALRRILDRVEREEIQAPPTTHNELSRLRELANSPHTGVRQQAIRALGVLVDTESAALLADVFAASLDFYDHDCCRSPDTTLSVIA